MMRPVFKTRRRPPPRDVITAREACLMLHTHPLQSERTRLPMILQPDRLDGAGVGELIKLGIVFVRRQYLVILVTAALVTASSLIYLRLVPPTYTAQVQIILGNPRAQFLQQQSLLSEPLVDVAQIETQLQIIKSRATAVEVINQLKLANHPDFKASGPSLPSLQRWIQRWRSDTVKDAQSAAPSQPSETTIAAFL